MTQRRRPSPTAGCLALATCLLATLLLPLLSACTSGSGALLASARATWQAPSALALPAPGLMLVRLQGRVARMALGFEEPLEPPERGHMQVWYGADGTLIKTLNGRIVTTAGLPVDWQAVRWAEVPAWSDLTPQGWLHERQIDAMPGYRYGLQQQLQLRPVRPDADWTQALAGTATGPLLWFEEKVLNTDWPASRFAVRAEGGHATVVYTRQCLERDWCLELFFPAAPAATRP